MTEAHLGDPDDPNGPAGDPAAAAMSDQEPFAESDRAIYERSEAAPVADSRIRAAVERLDELADLPTADHVEMFEDVHASLQDSLAEAARDQTHDNQSAEGDTPP